MRSRSSARRRSWPSWKSRGMSSRSAAPSARRARPATSMRGSTRPAASSLAPRRRRRRPWPSSPAGAARPRSFSAWPSPSAPRWTCTSRGFRRRRDERQAIAERLAAEDDAIRQLETQLQSLDLQHDVPTEEVLLAAHGRDGKRAGGWSSPPGSTRCPKGKNSPRSWPSSRREGR